MSHGDTLVEMMSRGIQEDGSIADRPEKVIPRLGPVMSAVKPVAARKWVPWIHEEECFLRVRTA